MKVLDNGAGGFYVYAPDYDIERTFTCGQCFRFAKAEDSEYSCEYRGVAHGRYMRFASDEEGNVHIIGAPRDEVESLWLHYLSLDRDYDEIKRQVLSDFGGHPFMKDAIERTGGLRILAQERFETLCSFIISQNNNIPRISKLIETLSEKYGEPIDTPYGVKYAFPTAEILSTVSEEELAALKFGYRAKYIVDAAKRVSGGVLVLDTLSSDNAREELLKVLGIGEKVASCIRLFAIEDLSSFPVDVWVKRIIANRFDGKLDTGKTGIYGGVAQQYLFCYERELSEANT
ncbi:MAG: DNA-3-methyladenine glycosylase 2 family protein [Clostridia bacterium]|nr:DNA-3-methyladenine glycosylase 2 family protein [Clostridia bacterium]